MSKWPGKYVIGLTGNIATGKSVVRRMLEHLGACTIDADSFSHRAIAKGAPGYRPVVDAFGKFILDANGEIDRAKLGRMAFSDPDVLKELETIVHPLVEQAVDLMIRRASQRIIVIEAIKLLEGKLVTACDAVWTSYAPELVQKARLVQKLDHRSSPGKYNDFYILFIVFVYYNLSSKLLTPFMFYVLKSVFQNSPLEITAPGYALSGNLPARP